MIPRASRRTGQPAAPAPANGGGPLLEATNISKIFGGLVAVNDITFTVPERAIVSLIGPNGAGKTTFFNCITGIYKPTTGRVHFNGKDITAEAAPDSSPWPASRAPSRTSGCSANMTAIENVHGREARRRLRPRVTGDGLPRRSTGARRSDSTQRRASC